MCKEVDHTMRAHTPGFVLGYASAIETLRMDHCTTEESLLRLEHTLARRYHMLRGLERVTWQVHMYYRWEALAGWTGYQHRVNLRQNPGWWVH